MKLIVRRSDLSKFEILAGCLFFLFLWDFSSRPEHKQDAWLSDLFEEARQIFYQTITDEISLHPKKHQLKPEEIQKIAGIEKEYPRLYGILINLYYQKDEPVFRALLEHGSEQSRSRFQKMFLDLARYAGHNFVECFFQPGPNAEYFRELNPRFKGKDKVEVIMMSLGYFARLDMAQPEESSLSPEFDRQWGLDAAKFRSAHSITKGRGVKMAIIDSGIDESHPVYRNTKLGQHFSLIGREGAPWDTDAPVVDWGWHGTVVSSIAARYAPEAQITLYKCMDADTMNDAPYPLLLAHFMAAGIYKAVHDGNDVINISAGLGNDFEYVREACQYAYENNVIIVTASPYYLGKYLGYNYEFPGNYNTTISVTGIEQRGEGKYGYWDRAALEVTTTIAAPNAPFVAYPTYVKEKDDYAAGISCATPIVASAAALAISICPRSGTEGTGEYFETIKKILTNNANPKAVGFQGFSPECGYGLIDAEKTVKAALLLDARRVPISGKKMTADNQN